MNPRPWRTRNTALLLSGGSISTASGHHQAKASFFSMQLVISAPLDLDLNIAAERAHEAEQPLKREALEAPAQQIGNVGLTDAHPLGRSLLGEGGLLDHLVDADDEASLDHVLVGIGQPEVGKDVAAAAGNGCLLLRGRQIAYHCQP